MGGKTSAHWPAPSPAYNFIVAARQALPRRIILVRHGESEGNIDETVYRRKADNLVELTNHGTEQSLEVGRRIKRLIGDEYCDLFVSPFQRTLQTSRNIRRVLGGQIRRTTVESRLREQEFGNMQDEEFKQYRAQQKDVGRFFYRFPTGESGADVSDRVKHWWDSTVMSHNLRPGYPPVENLLVVTHGLTMRFILMQLYNWSPHTFETVYNAPNCGMFVLQHNEKLLGRFPYFLDRTQGDYPKSSCEVTVELLGGERRLVTLDDYIDVPAPRTSQVEYIKRQLQDRHGIDPLMVANVDFFAGKFAKFQ
eukprot:CAMPEP_0172603446 /NCGR_PEP_ID=MMETSP1068-20121228/23695_1 /TAXON_ID=35684 /ORGANISM="Pseudopedinella elastica, Strain CCMP716" /LENGTH=307 /DNA_ID=CAMNT_0013405189 /DNA_START=356 /DNA_END=1279 /DNA_ORIENTATION=+